jgi:hypothetical protein
MLFHGLINGTESHFNRTALIDTNQVHEPQLRNSIVVDVDGPNMDEGILYLILISFSPP